MEGNRIWVSPDARIKKVIVTFGEVGLKPSENTQCIIEISDCSINVEKYNSSPVVIGQSNDSFERLLDIALTMMNAKEVANVTFEVKRNEYVTVTLKLKEFKSNGFIYEWDAKKKFELALHHKEQGVSLFKEKRHTDASHRFSRAIKLLASIPIEVQDPPTEVDGVQVVDIQNMKSNLCNNLASCYLRHGDYENVISLCKKVLSFDKNNTKALYKLAVAFEQVREYDKSHETLKFLLEHNPENKPALNKLKIITAKVNETNARVNAMIKRMFNI